MKDNSSKRLHDVFFYGLYMDAEILALKGVQALNPRKAVAPGFELRFGEKATMLRQAGKQTHGMLYSLTHDDINKLYWGAGLNQYRSEAIMVDTAEQSGVAALCCNLLDPPKDNESNPEYASKLKQVMQKLGLPILFD